jgi:ECF transporter S component (folate family)
MEKNCKGGVFMLKNRSDIFAPLRDVRVMTSAALLSAIAIILGFFKIPVTQVIEIRFAMLPIAVSGCLFGPVVGGIVGMVADIGGYLVKPTGPFFPGFTITSMVSGVIFGFMLYRQKPAPLRILMSQIVYTIICGVLLNSLWLSMLYGNGFIPVLTARFVKEIIMIPINTIMLVTIMEPVKRFRRAGAGIGSED